MAEIAAKDPYGHLVVEEKFFDIKFIHAFISSLSVIIVSEIGDKTFFIAAIMAMRHSRLTVFAGAIGALATMTVLSGLLAFFLGYFYPDSIISCSECFSWVLYILLFSHLMWFICNLSGSLKLLALDFKKLLDIA